MKKHISPLLVIPSILLFLIVASCRSKRDALRIDHSIPKHQVATLADGITLDEAEALLTQEGATNFSDCIQTTPGTRLDITEQNAYEMADSLQIPHEKSRAEMAAVLNSLFDQSLKLPRFAKLRYWRFKSGPDLEIYATSEVRDSLRVTDLRIYPEGYPHDKLKRRDSGSSIKELRIAGGEPHWK
jgi:hypothetical protein